MSQVYKEEITCPNCNTKGTFTCWSSINVDLDPEAKEKVKNGELFKYTCPKCGRWYNIEYETLYHDMSNKFMVQYLCNPTEERIKQFYNETEQMKKLNLVFDIRQRIVRDKNAFIEKIMIFENELDDAIVEVAKTIILQKMIENDPNMEIPAIYFHSIDDTNISFYIDDGRVLNTDRSLYDSLAETYNSIVPKNEFIEIDLKNAINYLKEKSN